jgi:HEAT repeat protein
MKCNTLTVSRNGDWLSPATFADHMKRYLPSLILAVYCCTGMATAEDKPVAELFEQLVKAEGGEYVGLRDELVERDEKVKPFLNGVRDGAGDWRQKVMAKIVLGWIDHADLYKQLWVWQPPRNGNINPYPIYCAQAKARFSEEGEKVVPLALELIWKKRDMLSGALPSLLADAKVEFAIPVLVRSQTAAVQALGQFGATATPYILEVLDDAEPARRRWLVEALGLTGGQPAIAKLRDLLTSDSNLKIRETAAISLGELKDYATLLDECFSPNGLKIRAAILKSLDSDDSEATREVLVKVATTASREKDGEPFNTARIQAIEALLNGGTDSDIAAVCIIAPKEPDGYTRSCIYVYLSSKATPLVRDALLNALNDPTAWVRERAIEGLHHYDDEEVTKRVLEVIQNDRKASCRHAGIFMLKDRVSPLVKQAATTWLKDKDPEIRKYAMEALANNSATAR